MAFVSCHMTHISTTTHPDNKDSFIAHSILHQFHSNKGQNISLGISIETTTINMLQKSHICHHSWCTLTIVPKNAYLCNIINYCKGSALSNHTRLCTNIDISSLHPTKNHHHYQTCFEQLLLLVWKVVVVWKVILIHCTWQGYSFHNNIFLIEIQFLQQYI